MASRTLICCLTLALASLLILSTAPSWAESGSTAKSYINAGNKAASSGDFKGAEQLYTKAIKSGQLSKANLAVAYMNRGSARDDGGNTDGAIADFTQALAQDPKLDLAYYNRSFAYEKKGLMDLAVKDMDQAVRLNSGDKDYMDRLEYLNQRLAGKPVIGGARP